MRATVRPARSATRSFPLGGALLERYLLSPSEALGFPLGVYCPGLGSGNEVLAQGTSSAGDHDEGIAEMDFQLSAAKLPEDCW